MSTITAEMLAQLRLPELRKFPLFRETTCLIGVYTDRLYSAARRLAAIRCDQREALNESFDNSTLDVTVTPVENPSRIIPDVDIEPSAPITLSVKPSENPTEKTRCIFCREDEDSVDLEEREIISDDEQDPYSALCCQECFDEHSPSSRMWFEADGERFNVNEVDPDGFRGYGYRVETDQGEYVIMDHDDAGNCVLEYYENMDRDELVETLGVDRIVSWGLGMGDHQGISSFEEFITFAQNYAEEIIATYDGIERSVCDISEALNNGVYGDIDVAYRIN